MEALECSHCHCSAQKETRAFLICPGCEAVVYCSRVCQQADWEDDSTGYCHKNWCPMFGAYMQNEPGLCDFPFPFTVETTSRDFSREKLKSLLRRHGVYNEGLWRRVSEDTAGRPVIPYGEMADDGAGYVLQEAQRVLSGCPAVRVPGVLRDWAGYYGWRGLALDCPVAHLLSYPLTVYHILTTCLQEHDLRCYQALMKKDVLRVLMVGVELEVELIPVFQELTALLPGVSVHIDMVGRSVSRGCHGRQYREGRLSVCVHRAQYHSWDGPAPDLIVGLNAGIAAYRSWRPTIDKIQKQNIPAYFTEYCEYFVDITHQTLHGAKSGEVIQRRLNPFRSPFRITTYMSNCFTVHAPLHGTTLYITATLSEIWTEILSNPKIT